MNADNCTEFFSNHYEVGSGSDAAGLYLASELQGIDIKKCSMPELMFYTMNAYCHSTINQGVGGTPKLARIGKLGVDVLDVKKTRALANISGAHLADINPKKLTTEESLEMFNNVYANETPDYKKIAKSLDINENTLNTMYIPYSSWKEKANMKLYSE